MRNTTSIGRIDVIPHTAGVYLFYSDQGHLLYIGKSVSLRARVRSHIVQANHSSKEERLIRQTVLIEWEETAGELGALLREAALIKQYQPIYNQRLRKSRILYGLKIYQTANNYSRLMLQRLSSIAQDEIHNLYGLSCSKRSLMEKIVKYTKEWNLCAKLTLLESGTGPCFYFQIKLCKGACIYLESAKEYNERLLKAFKKLSIESWPYESSIIIKEKSQTTSKVDYHKVDKWCHLASGTNKKALSNKKILHNSYFDFDIYKIIAKCLLTPSPTLKIIEDVSS